VDVVDFRLAAAKPKDWRAVARILDGWQVISGLGDNHAGAVGCGLADYETIVISAGTSGTVVRKCRLNQRLAGKASCFEYYNDRLLLMMLADCADWYVKFARWYCGCTEEVSPDLALLDSLAMSVPAQKLKFWTAKKRKRILAGKIPANARPELVANAQFSITVELLMRARMMLDEVSGKSAKPNRFVLTGGLCRSSFFREVLVAGIGTLAGAKVFVSDHQGPLAFQAATWGALINAMVGAGDYPDLASAIAELCPLKPVNSMDSPRSELLLRAVAKASSVREG
jgi:sugar (pentulose or hexulose) kinase